MTDKTLDVVFSRFKWNSFTRTLRQEPSGVSRIRHRITRLRDACSTSNAQKYTGLPQGYCVRVSSKSRNSTSCVLSVILMYLWVKQTVLQGVSMKSLVALYLKKLSTFFKLTFYPLFKKTVTFQCDSKIASSQVQIDENFPNYFLKSKC